MQLNLKTILPFFIFSLLFCGGSFAQNKDSLTRKEKSFFGRWIEKGMQSIHHKIDTTDIKAQYSARIENYYQPFEGKIIRNIEFREFGFERSFSDTASRIKYFGTNILNHLHTNSKSWVIRNNLFIKRGDSLRAYVIADNERYLRSLNYIRDARILIKTISPTSDSVDLLVVTKDLFSLTGSISNLNIDKQELSAGDENFLGLGQSISASMLQDRSRNPHYGMEAGYEKYNIGNSFTNVGVKYSDIGSNIYNYYRNEHGVFINIDRPLYSQYASFYGFLHLGNVWSVHSFPPFKGLDSNFYQYHYRMIDASIGYNIGAKKHLSEYAVPLRKVISLRYYNYNFLESPYQFQNRYVELLNNRTAYLAQFTLFKQKFFKTRYILGFGATEDIPYGYNFSFTGGWYKLKDLSRPYIGIDANRYAYSEKGDIVQFFLRTGTFFREGLQDGTILFGSSFYSRLMVWNKLKIRQFMRLSYTTQFNSNVGEPLRINNAFGLQDFIQDSIQGHQRTTLRSETVFYTPGKIFGFSFAPFLTGDFSYLPPTSQSIDKSSFFYGIGGGLRTRNENLVFGTIELKAIYFPKRIPGQHQFKVGITTNLRFRYNSNYVSAPELIQSNSDSRNDIF